MKALMIRTALAATAAAVSLAAPSVASAAPPAQAAGCGHGWACFWLGPDGTNRAMMVRDERWFNLTGIAEQIVVITNNQDVGDDACIADGPSGTGTVICAQPGEVVRLPLDFVGRSVRG